MLESTKIEIPERAHTKPEAPLPALVLAALALCFPACESSRVRDDCSARCCMECHGSDANAAPPGDTNGRTDPALATVGAHQSHLAASDWYGTLACTACHLVPACVLDAGHVDSSPPAELTWGELALKDGASPLYDAASSTCSGVYCHGATLMAGGTLTAPAWTVLDGTQASCGTCHGIPPGPPHVSDGACSNCHTGVIDESGVIVSASLHINGMVEVEAAEDCSACHGSSDNAAPPVDTQGRSDTAGITVGAHQAHLAGSDWHRPVECRECHLVPEASGDPGHVDVPPAELTFSSTAVEHAADPVFDRATGTCTGTYCHGAAFESDGTLTEPVWTVLDGTQDACGACHALPPPLPHPENDVCETCHFNVYDGEAFVNPERHINGMANF
jgi:predicted CxxxxCH...CXXCH cytochrome family protein